MKMMKAAVFKGNGILKVEEVPVPKVQNADQVVIRVKAASICGSDIHALHVPPGQVISSDIVLGHEFLARSWKKVTAQRILKLAIMWP